MSNMTAQADVLMTDEERAEMEEEIKAATGSPAAVTPKPTPGSPSSSGSSPKKSHTPGSLGRASAASEAEETSTTHKPAAEASPHVSKPLSPDEKTPIPSDTKGKERRGRAKMTPEQREKLKKIEEENRKVMEER